MAIYQEKNKERYKGLNQNYFNPKPISKEKITERKT